MSAALHLCSLARPVGCLRDRLETERHFVPAVASP
jgi:hypothetical protein